MPIRAVEFIIGTFPQNQLFQKLTANRLLDPQVTKFVFCVGDFWGGGGTLPMTEGTSHYDRVLVWERI